MKQAILLILFFTTVSARGQRNKDSLLIKEAALNYIEGYYEADWQRMSRAIHPELAKRVIIKDSSGQVMLQNMGSSNLLYNTKRNRNTQILQPGQPLKPEVIIYDLFNDIATVKVTTNQFRFIDYLHLGKFGDEWKIVNVLWEFIK